MILAAKVSKNALFHSSVLAQCAFNAQKIIIITTILLAEYCIKMFSKNLGMQMK